MTKLKKLELLLMAASVLISAARSLMKFMAHLKKLKQQRKACGAFA